MAIYTLPSIISRKSKRLGRGAGSGKGSHTVGRGVKGARARTGQEVPLWFEGGQLPLIKRLPYIRGKWRFKSLFYKPQLVKLEQLEKAGLTTITPATLKKANLIKDEKAAVKIIGNTPLTKVVTIEGIQISTPAKALVEKAGGKVA